MIEVESFPNFAAKIDIYQYKQTKSKVGKRWIRVKVDSFVSQGFTKDRFVEFFFGEANKNAISAATQIPKRMLFEGIGRMGGSQGGFENGVPGGMGGSKNYIKENPTLGEPE